MCLEKPINVLHVVSQKFPQCCLWNSSNVCLIDDGPFSSSQGRMDGAHPEKGEILCVQLFCCKERRICSGCGCLWRGTQTYLCHSLGVLLHHPYAVVVPNLPVTQTWCSSPPPLCCGCSKPTCDTALVFHHPYAVVVPNLPVTQPWCSAILLLWLFQTYLWHRLGVLLHHPSAVVVANLPVTQTWCSAILMLWLFQTYLWHSLGVPPPLCCSCFNLNLPVTQPWCSTPPPLCCGCWCLRRRPAGPSHPRTSPRVRSDEPDCCHPWQQVLVILYPALWYTVYFWRQCIWSDVGKKEKKKRKMENEKYKQRLRAASDRFSSASIWQYIRAIICSTKWCTLGGVCVPCIYSRARWDTVGDSSLCC